MVVVNTVGGVALVLLSLAATAFLIGTATVVLVRSFFSGHLKKKEG